VGLKKTETRRVRWATLVERVTAERKAYRNFGWKNLEGDNWV
jgi:hypothetical protein